MPKNPPFFLSGADPDSEYEAVRKASHHEGARLFIEDLWERYKPLADDHFLSDAQKHFHERFWEMYLACTLMENGIDLKSTGGTGPDFYFETPERKVWIEAVAPGPGTGADRAPEIIYGVGGTVAHDPIVLRLTAAIRDKKLLMESAISKGIVSPDDAIIIAVNHRNIPKAFMGSTIPFILKAVFPFGHLSVAFNRDTMEIVDSRYAYTPKITKHGGAEVSTEAFLDPAYAIVSGVIDSGVNCVNYPEKMGKDFLLVHNPTARQELPCSPFTWCRQNRYENGEIIEVDPEI